jgi:NodT family efflux transporter outer membrane factor (OMF) lipoprotein
MLDCDWSSDVCSSDLFPSLGGSLSDNRAGSQGSGSSRRSAVSLTASWEADLFGGQRRQVEGAEATAAAGAADLATTRLAAQATLAQNYVALRVADVRRRLLNTQADRYRKALELTRNRWRAGVVSAADVAQAEAQLRGTEANAIDLEVQRAQLEHAIAVLLGRPPSALELATGDLILTLPAIPAGLPSALLERRPDIAAAERRMAAANARIGIAQAAGYPALTLQGSLGQQAGGLASLLSAPTQVWTLGATLAQTLFDAGKFRAQTEEAQADFDAALADYRRTVLEGFREVEDNLSSLSLLAKEAAVQQQALAAARRSAELTLNQYKAGTVSYLNVVVVQAAALAAEQTAIDIEGRRLTAAVTLIKALGGGWTAAGRAE